MDVFFSEKALYGTGRIEAAIEDLRGKGLIYRGVLEPPKGKTPEDWEPREQTLFRSTAHGDDVDRPIRKSDGGWTYFAPDIAYHYDKLSRGFDALIDVFGADHGGYVKRMKAAVSALSGGKVPLDIKLTQLVRLFKNGEPFKMSKRAGNFVTLRDVVDQVGPDVTRFVMLTRVRRSARFRFRQGAGAEPREPGLLRAICPCAGDEPSRAAPPRPGSRWTMPRCCGPICRAWITRPSWPWPASWRNGRVWSRSPPAPTSRTASPSISTSWPASSTPFGIAATRSPALRFLQEGDAATSQAKTALARAVSVVISAGLGILGVTPAQEMR